MSALIAIIVFIYGPSCIAFGAWINHLSVKFMHLQDPPDNHQPNVFQ